MWDTRTDGMLHRHRGRAVREDMNIREGRGGVVWWLQGGNGGEGSGGMGVRVRKEAPRISDHNNKQNGGRALTSTWLGDGRESGGGGGWCLRCVCCGVEPLCGVWPP